MSLTAHISKNSKNNVLALNKLIQLEHEARDFGFDWPDAPCIIEQAMSECAEIQEALVLKETPERVQEEIGDLLHTAISLCLFSGFSVEETLQNVVKKFGTRLHAVQELTQQEGLDNLHGQSFEYMMELWKKAKKASY